MQIDVSIIGGTGIGERLSELGGSKTSFETPFGSVEGQVIDHRGAKILLLSRHSAGHKVPPHRVNYRAMASCLASLNVKGCFASAAVGSLRPDWQTGTFVACSDFLDYTNRQLTMFDETVVHTDFTTPFAESLRSAIIDSATDGSTAIQLNGVYVCTNGPRYETPQEIRSYRQLGGDVIGMTAATEAILMHEAGVPYACLAIVTNPAAGIGTNPLTHTEVVEEMQRAGAKAVEILLGAGLRIL